MQSRHPRRIAASIRVVVRLTLRRKVPSLRRLGKLPDFSKASPTLRRSRRLPRKRAPRRRRANVVGHKKCNLSSRSVLPNIVRRHDTDFAFFRRNPRAINPGAKSRRSYRVYPGVDVRLLLGEHPPTLFDVEKNDRARRKSFSSGSHSSSLSIRLAERTGISPQLAVKPPIEQNQKSKSSRLNFRALPRPGIGAVPRRIVQPVSGKGEGLAQNSKTCVARIFIAVKTEIGRGLRDGGCGEDRSQK